MAEKIVKDSQGLAKDLVNDCISRYGVSAWLANRGYRGLANKVMDEDRFPPVQPKSYREGYQAGFKDAQPERKRGKWEITNLGAVGVFDSCSECKRVVKHKAPFYNYCPNCGADMRGEQDG